MSICGVLDYRVLAELNRPTDTDRIKAEVQRLAATGLTASDVAQALKTSVVQVREMLAGAIH